MDALLVSRYPGTSHLPKAHVLHQKTMEIYRELGVAEAIYTHFNAWGRHREASAPAKETFHEWYRQHRLHELPA